ncbi:MAG: hydrogenase maturation protease [Leptolyngbyaceae cyanobacterium]
MNSTTFTTEAAHRQSFLVIGYGNALRGDDGVGPQVAMAVADWHLPSVKSLAVPQLLPELAADIATANYVIFVDACGQSCAPTIQLDPIVTNKAVLARCTAPLMNHVCEPLGLMALTHRLYGDHPQAWFLQIPTEHHDLGRSFSNSAQRGIDSALRTIEQFLTTYLRQPACLGA